MAKNKTIQVKGTAILVVQGEQSDFISLTDIAKHKDAANTDSIIQNWLRNRNTIELLGFWELMYNPDFKPLEFEGFKNESGANSFSLTPQKWFSPIRKARSTEQYCHNPNEITDQQQTNQATEITITISIPSNSTELNIQLRHQ